MATCGIYEIVNDTNQKRYIGYSKDIESRKSVHFRTLEFQIHRNAHLQNAYNLYGRHNFSHNVIQECSENELCFWEHYWATILKTHDSEFGYNIEPTAETRHIKKLRKKVLQYDLEGNFIQLFENLDLAASFVNGLPDAISHCASGFCKSSYRYLWKYYEENFPIKIDSYPPSKNTGRVCSRESVEKTASKLRGRKLSDEVRANISKGHIGLKASEETLEKLRKFQRNRKHKEHIGIKIINTVTGEIYNSISVVARILKLSSSGMRKKLIGKINNNTPYIFYDNNITEEKRKNE